MKKLLVFLLLTPLILKGQIHAHKHFFADSTSFKNFNQGFIDAKLHFNGTSDFLVGFVSPAAYFVPAAVCYTVTPKDSRLINPINPNNSYLFSDTDYYNGYQYGAKKKKRKRLIQGTATTMVIGSLSMFFVISTLTN